VPEKKIGAMGNTVVPALLALEQLGFEVSIQNGSVGLGETCSAYSLVCGPPDA